MSRASRRARGRQLEAGRSAPEPASGASHDTGAIHIDPAEHSVSIDLSKLDAPSDGYDADVAWVEHRPGSLSLLFGKRNHEQQDTLESRLEIRYPPEHLQTWWKNTTVFFERLKAYVLTWPPAAREGDEPPSNAPAQRTHSEWVSFAYISHSGSSAAIDFYHVSTSGLAKLNQGRQMEGFRPRPVVRVQMSSFALYALLARIQSILDDVEATVPELHKKEREARDEGQSN